MNKLPAVLFLFFCAWGLIINNEAIAVPKRAVLIIAEGDFQDREFSGTKEALETSGIEVKVASTTLKEVKGMEGAKAKADILLADVDADEFEAIVFIGGSGSSQYWDDPTAHRLAQKARQADKVIAAICIAPVALANAGILKGVSATVFYTEARSIEARGAKYTARDVERDGKIITASGPSATAEFAAEIVKALNK